MLDSLTFYEGISPIERNFQVKLKLSDNVEHYRSHWHEHLELLYFLSGDLEITCGDTDYEVHESDLMIINSGERHSINRGKGVKQLCMHLSPQFFADIDFENYIFERHIIGDSFVKECFEKIYDEQESRSPAYDMRIKSIAYSLMAYLVCHYRKERLSENAALIHKNKLRSINEVFVHIERNYSAALTTRDLAAHFHLTEQYFCHVFKEKTGKTPTDYINRYRVEKAAFFLKNTDKSITDIALSVGFEDSNYFARVFKKHMGVSPRAYRKGE